MSTSNDYNDRYEQIKEEFAALRGYVQSVSVAGTGRRPISDREEYAALIFTKIAAHATSSTALVPSGLRPTGPAQLELWDLSSLCAIVRCLVDAFYALAYVAEDFLDEEEWAFRKTVWELHAYSRRLHLLELVKSTHPELVGIRQHIEDLRGTLESHPLLRTLPPKWARDLARGKHAYHLQPAELNKRLNIDHGFYRATYVFLSTYVHTHPFSLHQLTAFRAGEAGSLATMGIAVQYATAFLVLSIRAYRAIVTFAIPTMPEQVSTIVDDWTTAVSQGFNPGAVREKEG